MSDRPLRLDICCPVCGTPPAVRVLPALVALAAGLEPDVVVITVQCQRCARHGQLVKYGVEARAVQGAA